MANADTTVLVTGASGFIGSHCVIRLLNEGYRVRGTVREMAKGEAIRQVVAQHAPTELLSFTQADLTRDDGWPEALAGCEFVMHIASPLPRVMPKAFDALVAPARDGALRVLRAASEAGVRRVVMTASTASVFYGYGDTQQPYDETFWSDPDSADNSPYTRSKTIAERAAWAFMDEQPGDMELVTVNPSAVLGPVLETDYGTSAEIVFKLLKGEFPGTPKLGFPLVDVRDIADLHLRAMTHPDAAGQRYLGGGDFWWMSDIAAVLREHLPSHAKKMPARQLPNWLVKIVAAFDPVTRGVLFELGIKRECDSGKAQQQLGWQPRDNAQTIRDTADSLLQLGLV